jgi:phosphoribosylglycinamide formyltransferase-1
MYHLAIFASGSGSNAENIIRYFANDHQVRVSCVCTNRPEALVVERAKKLNIPVLIFTREDLYHSDRVVQYLENMDVHWVILAGFLWLVPTNLLARFPQHIINIHPALLPKFGGKGMYGHHVHKAVIDQHETTSGITIHYVNSEYDRGATIFQATCAVEPGDTPEMLAARIHKLEHEHFPRVIRQEVVRP